VADEVKPLILQELRKNPAFRDATIQNVSLIHKGGKAYSGFVDATIGGRAQQLPLDVVFDGGAIHLELKPPHTAPDPGTLIEFNRGKLFYTSAVSREEAQKLGEFLFRERFFDGNPKDVQLHKEGRTYEVRLVVQEGTERNPQTVEVMKQFGVEISNRVFESAPVDIHLCDTFLRTIRVVVPPRS
jgi:hypothetical protein